MCINIYKHCTTIRWIIIPLHPPNPVRLYNTIIVFVFMCLCCRQFRQNRFGMRVRVRSFHTTGHLQSTAQIMVQFCRGKYETGSSANILKRKTTNRSRTMLNFNHVFVWFQNVIFNIVNISNKNNLFKNGMTPIVRSTSRNAWYASPIRYDFIRARGATASLTQVQLGGAVGFIAPLSSNVPLLVFFFFF
jgi:hypothetical protein